MMSRYTAIRHGASLACLFMFLTTVDAGFVRSDCYAEVQKALTDGSIATDDEIFHRDEYGMPQSTLEYPVLTLAGCNDVCGKGLSWNPDAGPRLSTWLIPMFLLLSNMEVSPLDKRRYLMLVHLLGDPIHSIWSLLMKLEAWSRCYSKALGDLNPTFNRRTIRIRATVLGGMEELVGFYTDPSRILDYTEKNLVVSPEEYELLLDRTAQRLADSRTDERLRTLLATGLYLYQLVSAFVSTVGGGNTSLPGGRIGTTMSMTWIITVVLLSNAIGGFTSCRTCFDIIEDFVRNATGRRDLWLVLCEHVPEFHEHRDIEDYFASMSWTGSIYTYRPPKKIAFSTGARDWSAWSLLALAMAPIVISSTVGSVLLYHTPPVAFNCRNMLIFSIVMLFFASAAFTWTTAWLGIQGRFHWYLVLVKDALIAFPSVILIFLAVSGVFNNCWCWSGVYTLGISKAHVPLNPDSQFVYWNRFTYPILVGICLLLEIVSFMTMMWFGWRGWGLMRWSEKDKMEEWHRGRQAVPVRGSLLQEDLPKPC